MAMPVEKQLKYWGIAAAVAGFLLWYLGDVILPFVLGGAIAYCLDPIADALERLGFSRALATATITLFAVLIFVLLALLVIPTLINQATALAQSAPDLFRNLQAFLSDRFPQLFDESSTVRQSLIAVGDTVKAKGGDLLNTVLSSALSVINVILLIFIVPVVAFYLLLDWDRMVAEIDELLPRDHAPVIRRLAREIDATLASFIRGQGTVMLVLGAFYATALMIAGLRFGLVIGVTAGLLSFIPYVGAIVGGGLAIGLALYQFWGDWMMIAVVAGIFFAGQMLEGNVLTPKLVGGSVGLHPVWLLLALSVFGSLFGFVGMLVAVPVSAALGVLARFAVEKYKEGPLYRSSGAAEKK
ncbi:Predicted PurR-regulated permease PerM [Meinhardsimonia xiamenensis]|uniref:Predicted PurR-regulated permease PerM n=1 Tax=Meinhardsimonia xiamenensis TaxID=990712 RepID=A0A1G9BHB4_9RHOB|nr:AI-2E family transporter [Meinhardsimonia xiamenensis]PRX34980.1 putative PurR-regulated permease PerM [Meinhardsimonia xiamenensis]SDK38899.1 Predicted PurR-regulated permease PerM [Meinhardsimonia xiamenensis]